MTNVQVGRPHASRVTSCRYGAQVNGPELDRVLMGLTAAQRDAVMSTSSPLCVMAGAGSGKTRVLTRRVARRVLDGSADAGSTLVLTFTRKSAGELRKRLEHLGVAARVNAGTFHAVAYAQLRRYWADSGVRRPSIIDSPERFLGRVLKDVTGTSFERTFVSAVAAEISWARARIVAPDDYASEARRAGRTSVDGDLVATVFGAYSEQKRRRGVVDLDDLVERCAELLERDTVFAQAQQWLFRHFFVDELQDLNPAQWRLLEGWLGGRTDLFVVGDPLQAIYSWNGADPGLLESIGQVLPGTTVLHLDDNHRCTEPVVELARSVLPAGAALDRQIRSARDDHRSVIAMRDFEDDEAEALGVAHWVRERHAPGRPWSSIAVLARTNARLVPIAHAFERSGIPFSGRGENTHSPGADAISVLRGMPAETPLRSALADVSSEIDDIEWLAAEIDDLCSVSPDADVREFLLQRQALGGSEEKGATGRTSDAVHLVTFHRAKGLEWQSVAVVGLEAGMVPIAHAVRAASLDEERRLLYVAITRAESEVWCSWSRRRNAQDKTWSCDPSPYLPAMRLALPKTVPPDPVPPSERISALRSALSGG